MRFLSEDRNEFMEFDSQSLPISKNGRVLSEIYVELPNNQRFMRYICLGDALEERHLKAISQHSVPKFFVLIKEVHESQQLNTLLESDSENSNKKILNTTTTQSHQNTFEPIVFESSKQDVQILDFHSQEETAFLKIEISEDIKNVFNENINFSAKTLSLEKTTIFKTADKILKVISPDLHNIREQLKRIPSYIGHIEDSAALIAISTLFAVAKGQTSRNSFRDLAYACLFMDISLLELKPEERDLYWTPHETLPRALQKKFQNHPMRSFEIIQKKFHNFPDIVSQLIVGHHELFSGQGYPRNVRSELLAPMVRLLAFSVDVFEYMKRNQQNSRLVSVEEAVQYFLEEATEPHLRRHNLSLCRDIWNYIQKPTIPT